MAFAEAADPVAEHPMTPHLQVVALTGEALDGRLSKTVGLGIPALVLLDFSYRIALLVSKPVTDRIKLWTQYLHQLSDDPSLRFCNGVG